jgi:hypothetical protein
MSATLTSAPELESAWVGARVYLAARFERRYELRDVAHELSRLGATVVSSWLHVPEPLASEDLNAPPERVAELAAADLRDVSSATIVIAFTEKPHSKQGRGGRHVELGVALAMGQRVVIVGPREHIFHCLPQVEQYDNWGAAKVGLLRPRAAAVA